MHSTILSTAGSVDVEMLAKRLIFAFDWQSLSGGIFRMDGWRKIIRVASRGSLSHFRGLPQAAPILFSFQLLVCNARYIYIYIYNM